MNELELDARIRELLGAVAAQAPTPPPFPKRRPVAVVAPVDDDAPSYVAFRAPRESLGRRTKGVLAAAAAVVVVVAAGAALVWIRGVESSSGPAGPAVTGGGVTVTHEVWQYTQSAELTCPNGEVAAGEFDSSTIETWTDDAGGRVRQDVVYPDGSRRSVIQLDSGSLSRPAPVFDGAQRGQISGCRGVMNFVTEPATAGLEDFTAPVGPASSGALEGLGGVAEHASGPNTDSTGRPAELWMVNSRGSVESVGSLDQQMSYYLDPDTGLLLERRLVEQFGSYGSVVEQLTLVSRDQTNVDGSIFDTGSSGGGSGSSSTVPSSVFSEEGTCARGGSASVCVVRRDSALFVKAAGLASGSTIELFFDAGGSRSSVSVPVAASGMIDSQQVLGSIDPAQAVIVGVTGVAADNFPLNNSITIYR